MKQLFTRWSKNIDLGEVHREYPRPQFVRDSYVSLNGMWEYAISQTSEVSTYEGEICVPFSPEAYLSGVGKLVKPEDYLHYRKTFTLPDGFRQERVLLHFGAVDQECTVTLNGTNIGEHIGGYLPFTLDITEHLLDVNILTLCVTDKTEEAPHARGKQKLVKKGKYGSLFYTPNSGIWKSVWLESVSENYLKELKITPNYDESSVSLFLTTDIDEEAFIEIYSGNELVKKTVLRTNQNETVHLENFIAWSPENPHLYDLVIKTGKDQVKSYFGMRKFSTGLDAKGILRFYLNNKPFFYNGVLDQGYWPEGLLTPPSDEALKYDIVKLKELGFNTIRKHIKIESDRFYYHCDKIGMIVWQDMPNGGGDYNMLFVTYLPNASNWFARNIKDSSYGIFKRQDLTGRIQYFKDLENMIKHLYSFTSIAVWVPFNEGWGQFDAKEATARIRNLDNTRLINEACGWFDQGGGDMYSIHNYIRKLKVKPRKDRVVALTEYGGYTYSVAGHTACEKEFGYKANKSTVELTMNYEKLFHEQIIPNVENGLSSAIYTQTSDIEEEINGLMTYDREILKMDIERVRRLNVELYEVFEKATESLTEQQERE